MRNSRPFTSIFFLKISQIITLLMAFPFSPLRRNINKLPTIQNNYVNGDLKTLLGQKGYFCTITTNYHELNFLKKSKSVNWISEVACLKVWLEHLNIHDWLNMCLTIYDETLTCLDGNAINHKLREHQSLRYYVY